MVTTLDQLEAESERSTQRLLAKATLVCGVASLFMWWLAGSAGLRTQWDYYGIAVMSVGYLLSGALILAWPAQAARAFEWLAVVPTMIYHWGIFYVAIQFPDRDSYYAAASATLLPLMYIGLFIGLPRKAVWLSCVYWGGYVLLYGLEAYWVRDARLVAFQDDALHLLSDVVLSHPVYIITLRYIVQLREQVFRTRVLAHEEKSQFMRLLTHEIRGLLQRMVYAIESLSHKLRSDAEQRALSRLMSHSELLKKYLQDLGELTRLENPALRTQAEFFYLRAIVEDVREEWTTPAADQGLQLNIRLVEAEGGEGIVRSDPSRLRQVISNLISNAIKYTRVGEITVEAAVVEGPEKRIEIMVQDTGIGIDPEHQHRIFEPYVRLDNAREASEHGSGLGLTIVRQIISSLGGGIQVESALGQGTTFRVSVPG